MIESECRFGYNVMPAKTSDERELVTEVLVEVQQSHVVA